MTGFHRFLSLQTQCGFGAWTTMCGAGDKAILPTAVIPGTPVMLPVTEPTSGRRWRFPLGIISPLRGFASSG